MHITVYYGDMNKAGLIIVGFLSLVAVAVFVSMILSERKLNRIQRFKRSIDIIDNTVSLGVSRF